MRSRLHSIKSLKSQFYFQIRFLTLKFAQAQILPIKILLCKDQTRLDETKRKYFVQDSKIEINQQNLSFSIMNYNPYKNYEFKLKLLEIKDDQSIFEMGQITINSNKYIASFLKSDSQYSNQNDYFNSSIQLNYFIFVHNSRINLLKTLSTFGTYQLSGEYEEKQNITPMFQQIQNQLMSNLRKETVRTFTISNQSLNSPKILIRKLPLITRECSLRVEHKIQDDNIQYFDKSESVKDLAPKKVIQISDVDSDYQHQYDKDHSQNQWFNNSEDKQIKNIPGKQTIKIEKITQRSTLKSILLHRLVPLVLLSVFLLLVYFNLNKNKISRKKGKKARKK